MTLLSVQGRATGELEVVPPVALVDRVERLMAFSAMMTVEHLLPVLKEDPDLVRAAHTAVLVRWREYGSLAETDLLRGRMARKLEMSEEMAVNAHNDAKSEVEDPDRSISSRIRAVQTVVAAQREQIKVLGLGRSQLSVEHKHTFGAESAKRLAKEVLARFHEELEADAKSAPLSYLIYGDVEDAEVENK